MTEDVFYNDNDPFAARRLRNLAAAGLITPGHVSHESIRDLRPEALVGRRRVHLFAGVGGWDYAIRLAGWPDGRPVWTGSCPCQPFSAAGRQKGEADGRHLWPEFRRLVAECRPPTLLGEQVAGKLGRKWLAGVRSDLEALGYAVGAADLCSACSPEEGRGWFLCGDRVERRPVALGAPHIRQRLFWVAVAVGERVRVPGRREAQGTAGRVQGEDGQRQRVRLDPGPGGDAVAGRVGDAPNVGRDEERPVPGRGHEGGGQKGAEQRPWRHFDAIPCLDGRARRVEPGTFPLAHGIPERVGRLRGYGNAIDPWVASTFVRSFLEAEVGPCTPSP